MSDAFFSRPVINSPSECPNRHWELDNGQPTQRVLESRRRAEFVTPIPKPKKRKRGQAAADAQADLGLDGTAADGHYELMSLINEVRSLVGRWRSEPDQAQWGVTPETARLLAHWRQHDFSGPRPFFCQIEAVEAHPRVKAYVKNHALGFEVPYRVVLSRNAIGPTSSCSSTTAATIPCISSSRSRVFAART
jgi:hypothetical protein